MPICMPQKTNRPAISGNEINIEIENINQKLVALELEKKVIKLWAIK